jgi:hypothetical protein
MQSMALNPPLLWPPDLPHSTMLHKPSSTQ